MPGTSPADPAPARPGKRINRREEILQAAAEVFVAQGFHNASLADIAAVLGITPAGILHHFGSKADLLTAVLEDRDRSDPPPEGAPFLRHLVHTAEVNSVRRGTTQLYAVLSAESVTPGHPAQAWFRNRYAGLRGDVERALLDRMRARAAESGSGEAEAGSGAVDGDGAATGSGAGPAAVSERRLADAAAAVVAVMDGLQVQWLLDPESVDMSAVTSLVIDSLAARLAADPQHEG